MTAAPHRLARLAGLWLLGALVLAVGGWGVLALAVAGPPNTTVRGGLAAGFADYLTKPLDDLAVLEHSVRRALQELRLVEEQQV